MRVVIQLDVTIPNKSSMDDKVLVQFFIHLQIVTGAELIELVVHLVLIVAVICLHYHPIYQSLFWLNPKSVPFPNLLAAIFSPYQFSKKCPEI